MIFWWKKLAFFFIAAAPLCSASPGTPPQPGGVAQTPAPEAEKMNPEKCRGSVATMILLLRKDPESARSAADILARCGPDAKPAVDDLVEALRYDDPAVSTAVVGALLKIGDASI